MADETQLTEDSVVLYALSPSSSSSSNYNAPIVPITFSPDRDYDDGSKRWKTDHDHPFTENGDRYDEYEERCLGMDKLRFIGDSSNGGMEWEEVENRFDRLALRSDGRSDQPAVKWSDFGFCIGMQKSPEFAKELLRALRGRRGMRAQMTKMEVHGYWRRITDNRHDSKINIFFDMCDKDMDGSINEMDMKQMILLTASTNKLTLTNEEAEEYAELVMDALDKDGQGYIQFPQMEKLLKLGLSKDHFLDPSTPQYYTPSTNPNPAPMSAHEFLFRSNWRRLWFVVVWLLVCASLFAWKFLQYRHRMAFEVMGYCLCTAKGAAETLKFNMAIILLPVCRGTLTWIRTNRRISSVVSFNDNINFHKLIASGIVIGVILHGGTHLACDFPRITTTDRSIFRQTIASRFGYHQPSYIEILATTEAATGIAMVILMAIIFSLATKWPRRQSPTLPRSVRQVTGYNAFWYSHHMFILVYALLIVHSMFLFLTSNLIEKTTIMYIAFPVLLYTGERVFRAVRSGLYEVKISKVNIYPGKVVSIEFLKPKGFEYRSGMSVSIQCPQISAFEWHPFSLTSGPHEDHLSLHIRTLGDWSYRLYSLFQEAVISREDEYPKIYMDGPYGATSQDYVKYDIVLLVGLGIGATPFISILKDVLLQNKQMNDDATRCPSKAYLYWVTREQSSFAWFRDFIKELPKGNRNKLVVEMHNFLTCMYKEEDARATLLSAIQVLYHANNGIDIVSKTPVHTHFARPNWFNIFSKLSRKHQGARIGVFYCGASGVARELERLCTKLSTRTTTRFVFHKERY